MNVNFSTFFFYISGLAGQVVDGSYYQDCRPEQNENKDMTCWCQADPTKGYIVQLLCVPNQESAWYIEIYRSVGESNKIIFKSTNIHIKFTKLVNLIGF